MNSKKFAIYTEAIIKKLPYWFKIKKDHKHSVGASFINVMGLELDDIRMILDYAYKQVYISSIDISQIDILYKAEIHDSINCDEIELVHHSKSALKIVETLPEFMCVCADSINNPAIHDKPYCFIDKQRKLVYVHHPYDANNGSKYGRITIHVKDNKYEYSLEPHHVWNFLDEFGMLVDCKRLFCENNKDYKDRILDVFRNVANASRTGLLNGIARELGIRKFITWEDASKDLVITEPMVVLDRISVDGCIMSIQDVFLNNDGDVVLKGNASLKDVVKEVSFIAGIEMHEMHDKSDIKLSNELVKVDGMATDLLRYYTERLRTIAPIKWNDFIWNESYWDASSEEVSGLAFLPNIKDSKITGFKKFKLNS